MVQHYDRFRADPFTADKNVIETSKKIDKTEKVHLAELGYYGAFTALQQILLLRQFKTQFIFSTKANQLLLLREIITSRSENNKQNKFAVWAKYRIFYVAASTSCSSKCAK